MNPNGVLEVDDIMLLVDKLQHYEKEDLANRLSQYRTTAMDDDDDEPTDAEEAVEEFGATTYCGLWTRLLIISKTKVTKLKSHKS